MVIPKKIRDELGIHEGVLLTVTVRGDGVYISPLEKSLGTSDSKKIALEILKRTAGSWAGDSWEETESKRREIELKVAEKRRKAW